MNGQGTPPHVASSLASIHVHRLMQLVHHLFPSIFELKRHEITEERLYERLADDNGVVFLLLVGNMGETEQCNDLSICNVIRDYSRQFELYSRCIINVHNDLFHLLYLLQNIYTKLKSTKRGSFNYNMICNYDCKKSIELIQYFSAKNYSDSVDCISKRQQPLNIIYWSGHGEQNLGLAFQGNNHLGFDRFLQFFKNGNEHVLKLFVMECCFSNQGEISKFLQNVKSDYEYLFVCSSIEKSGGWICDGTDSNGILTNFITDPVSSYFKVKYKIFFDLGTNSQEYFPYLNAPIKSDLYRAMDRSLSRIFNLVYPSNFLSFLSKQPPSIHAIIRLIYKHFVLFKYCAKDLYQPQQPISVPAIQNFESTNVKKVFQDMDADVEHLILQYMSCGNKN